MLVYNLCWIDMLLNMTIYFKAFSYSHKPHHYELLVV